MKKLPPPVRARLASGEVVELAKDCDCRPELHAGPCWLHEDAVDRKLNDRLRGRTDAPGMLEFCRLEAERCGRKADAMERAGIAELLRDTVGTKEEA